MKDTRSRKPRQPESWPRRVTVGRVSISVYRRTTPQGNFAFMVANYSGEKRRFDSYASEADALEAATRLARQMSQRDVISASMTREQSVEYASAIQTLKPIGVSLTAAVATVVEAVKLAGDLTGVIAAARFYKARHKPITQKRVADVVTELLEIKEARGASDRYRRDLRLRLTLFADAFQCNAGSVTTADVQAWLDGLKLGPQSYTNYRRVVSLLFEFAKARGYCMDNPVADVERIKVKGGETEIYTPVEIQRLLSAASPDFLPCVAIGAFAGLRSAEIERLEWQDIHLAEKHIEIGKNKAKTASRRIVPISDNLAAWLAPYAAHKGKIWKGGWLYKVQQDTAKKAGIPWKHNALRHSCASYMFALSNDAGRVAGFLGNSANVVHRHYRELVAPSAAKEWFSIAPEGAANILPMPQALVAVN